MRQLRKPLWAPHDSLYTQNQVKKKFWSSPAWLLFLKERYILGLSSEILSENGVKTFLLCWSIRNSIPDSTRLSSTRTNFPHTTILQIRDTTVIVQKRCAAARRRGCIVMNVGDYPMTYRCPYVSKKNSTKGNPSP